MRNLCLALILANLAFAAWQYGRSAPDTDARDVARDVPAVRLASEAGPDDAAVTPARDAPGIAGPDRDTTGRDAGPGGASGAGASSGADEPRGAAAGEGPGAGEPAPDGPAEAAAGELGEAASPAAGEPAVAGGLRCRSVGPFEELSQAAAAASALRAEGYEPSQRVAEGDIWVGYWVYLDDVPSGEQAETILAELADGGIPEAYLIRDAEGGGNVISLGVFVETSRSERRRGEARELGYEPVVEDRTRRGNVYWVDVVLEPGTAALDLAGLQPAERIVRLEQRPCP